MPIKIPFFVGEPSGKKFVFVVSSAGDTKKEYSDPRKKRGKFGRSCLEQKRTVRVSCTQLPYMIGRRKPLGNSPSEPRNPLMRSKFFITSDGEALLCFSSFPPFFACPNNPFFHRSPRLRAQVLRQISLHPFGKAGKKEALYIYFYKVLSRKRDRVGWAQYHETSLYFR